MGALRNLISFMSGSTVREVGQQSAGPGAYQYEAATNVTVDSALQLSAVWACVRLLSETIGTLPIVIYEVDDDGTKKIIKDHPLSKIFSGRINKWQTSQEFIECILYQYVLQGNSYAAIEKNTKGDIIALIPLMTSQMETILDDNGDLKYIYTDSAGKRVYNQDQIWHNKLFGNGIIGLSPIAFARNSIAIASASENSVTKIYKNGGKPSGILSVDAPLKPDQRKKIKENFSELAEGNSDRLFVLEANMKWEQVSLSPQDIELLASRRYQVEDICRFWGVPSILVNDTSSGTSLGTTAQEIILSFYKFGLKPYLSRIAKSIEVNLMTAQERVNMSVEFDVSDLLQPSRADRIKSGKEGVTGGLFSPNEWRKEEGQSPKDGGDALIVQQQMIPIDQIEGLNRPQKDPEKEEKKDTDR